jgi:hypothetical protein
MGCENENKISGSEVDDRISRITNILLLNTSFIDNPGLLNGKMGIAIYFYYFPNRKEVYSCEENDFP